MAFDAWTCMAKCLSNWRLIQAQMAMVIAILIVMLGLSGYTYQNNGGDFSSSVGGSFSSWEKNICKKGPYMYLLPFAFTYTTSSGDTATTYSTCGFPQETTTFRFVITVFGLLTVLSLYLNTPISIFGRYIFIMYGILFYSAMVLDSKSTVDGNLSCRNGFLGTDLADALKSKQYVLTCNSSSYEGVIFIDLFLSVQFFFLATSWSLCQNKYPAREKSQQQQQQKMDTESTKNPMIKSTSNTSFAPAPTAAPKSSWSKSGTSSDVAGAWA